MTFPIPAEAERVAREVQEDANNWLQAALDGPVELLTDQDYQDATAQLKEIKRRANVVEEERKRLKKPILEAGRRVDELFKPVLDTLAQGESQIKQGVLAYRRKLDEERREAQRKLDEEAEKKRQRQLRYAEKARARGDEQKAEEFEEKAEAVPDAVVVAEEPRAEGISTRKGYDAEVVDFTALVRAVAAGEAPESLLQVNQSALRRLAGALQDSLDIPGVKLRVTETVVARS